jgi:hypothetical protein
LIFIHCPYSFKRFFPKRFIDKSGNIQQMTGKMRINHETTRSAGGMILAHVRGILLARLSIFQSKNGLKIYFDSESNGFESHKTSKIAFCSDLIPISMESTGLHILEN